MMTKCSICNINTSNCKLYNLKHPLDDKSRKDMICIECHNWIKTRTKTRENYKPNIVVGKPLNPSKDQ